MAEDPDVIDGSPVEAVIEEPLALELEKFPGKWVAVFQEKVVAVGDSAPRVMEAASAKGITDPLIFRVALNPRRIAFL